MNKVLKTRLTIPKTAFGEIVRHRLIDTVTNNTKGLTYILGGAGFGKTTLLSQFASFFENVIWLTLDGEDSALALADALSQAIKLQFPYFVFNAFEYLIFEGEDNYVSILANAILTEVETISDSFVIMLDDLHTIKDLQTKNLIIYLIKYKPQNLRLFFSSREALWEDLVSQYIKGHILILSQEDLKFSRDEVSQILKLDDEGIYNLTEGWPIAISFFRVLLENGISVTDLQAIGNDLLYSYLFFECVRHLPSELLDFLKSTACFRELDPQMLDFILDIKNSKRILDRLLLQNLFITKLENGQYRYHALFREYLLVETNEADNLFLLNKAAMYYFNKGDYFRAADYSIYSRNKDMLRQILLLNYQDCIKRRAFATLYEWFKQLDQDITASSPELLVAKGVYLSYIGKFSDANRYLDAAGPLLKGNSIQLYTEVMLHKARVVRNYSSFEESDMLLDEILSTNVPYSLEMLYAIVIEKLYNLCWESKITEAYNLANSMIEKCAMEGNLRVKAWFERYLVVVHAFAGRMKDALFYYEKSLELPESDAQYLELHCVGIYAAKAYQCLGDQSKAVSLISAEIDKLITSGRFEEMWAAYVVAAEIHYHIAEINRINKGSQAFDTAIMYFTLANEYAPLYRHTKFQVVWVKMQRLIGSIIFTSDEKESVIRQIFAELDQVPDFLKIVALGRTWAYYASIHDYNNAVKYARYTIEVGEKVNIMLPPIIAYGFLARSAIVMKDYDQAKIFTRRYLQLCSQNGIYDYFRLRKFYAPVLEFALKNNIELSFTKQMMAFAGYIQKKAYIHTFGGFSVSPYGNQQNKIKMRTKKERELMAFLINAGSQGATKEHIIEALWFDSDSKDVKKLVGVYLAQIKKDLSELGIANPVIFSGKHYRICRDEFELDIDEFENALSNFTQSKDLEKAQKIVTLYKGEYLAGFEALWATSKRILCQKAYEEALNYCLANRKV